MLVIIQDPDGASDPDPYLDAAPGSALRPFRSISYTLLHGAIGQASGFSTIFLRCWPMRRHETLNFASVPRARKKKLKPLVLSEAK